MTTSTGIGRIIAAAWAEAVRRGIEISAADSSRAVTEIALEMIEKESHQRLAAELAEKEAREEKSREQYLKQHSKMHPDSWAGAIWPDGRAVYYRKDSSPPPGVAEALANGDARPTGRTQSCGASPTPVTPAHRRPKKS